MDNFAYGTRAERKPLSNPDGRYCFGEHQRSLPFQPVNEAFRVFELALINPQKELYFMYKYRYYYALDPTGVSCIRWV